MPHVRETETPQDERDAKYRNWDAYDYDPDSKDEVTPFKDLIQRDPTVCDHCFMLRYVEVSHEWWRGSFGWLPHDQFLPIPDRNIEIPAEAVARGMRLTCSNCGHRKTKHRPIPADAILDLTENISDTLDSKGFEHDRDVLFSKVQELNTSENQGKQDTHVFAPAVMAALRATGTLNIRDEEIVARGSSTNAKDDEKGIRGRGHP